MIIKFNFENVIGEIQVPTRGAPLVIWGLFAREPFMLPNNLRTVVESILRSSRRDGWGL